MSYNLTCFKRSLCELVRIEGMPLCEALVQTVVNLSYLKLASAFRVLWDTCRFEIMIFLFRINPLILEFMFMKVPG